MWKKEEGWGWKLGGIGGRSVEEKERDVSQPSSPVPLPHHFPIFFPFTLQSNTIHQQFPFLFFSLHKIFDVKIIKDEKEEDLRRPSTASPAPP
jgi:hypothetical protein